MAFKGRFQPKQFYDSVNLFHVSVQAWLIVLETLIEVIDLCFICLKNCLS